MKNEKPKLIGSKNEDRTKRGIQEKSLQFHQERCSFPLLEAYANKFKQSTTFFMRGEQRKAWQGVEEKSNLIKT